MTKGGSTEGRRTGFGGRGNNATTRVPRVSFRPKYLNKFLLWWGFRVRATKDTSFRGQALVIADGSAPGPPLLKIQPPTHGGTGEVNRANPCSR